MKKILLIVIAGMLFHCHCYAQNKDKDLVDSLVAKLPRMKEDTAKVNLYIKIINAYLYYDPNEGLAYQSAALDLATKTGWKLGIAKIKDRIGRLNWRIGNYVEALKNHIEGLEFYENSGSPYARYILIEIGQDYLDQGKYAEAESYLLKAEKLCIENNDIEHLASAYDVLRYMYGMQGNTAGATKMAYNYLKTAEQLGDNNSLSNAMAQLALIFEETSNYPEALKYFKQRLLITRGSGDNLAESYALWNLARIYTITGNFTEATNDFTEALRLAEESKNVNLLGDVHTGIGNLLALQGQYMQAIRHYTNAGTCYKSIAHKGNLALLYSFLGTAYTRLGKYNEATKSFNKAKTLYKELDANLSMSDYYRGLALLDSATGNWKDAYQNYRKYAVINDSSFNRENLKKAVASQMKYESNKKEANIKAEQEKKDIVVAAEIRRQRNIRNAAFGVLVLVLGFSVVVFRQRNKIALEKKRSDQLLTDNELLLKEIHHRVKNNLEVVSSLLELQSAQIDDPNTKNAMREGQNRVHSIGIVHQKLYQGTNLGAIEMKDYFINLSKSILDSFGAEKRVTIECCMDNLDVDIDTAVPLGLIVNELLTNTLKYAFPHAQHGNVQIKLQKQADGILKLQVSDNGIGKSGITHGTGFGGQLVALLTQQLGGSIREEVNNGTNIYFEFKPTKAA